MVESTEIYITGVRYKSESWYSNPDELLDTVADYLYEISGFVFISLSLNMSQVHNVSIVSTQYDAMMLYLKGVKYQGTSFLSEDMIRELRDKIIEKLNQLPEFEFVDVQLRSGLKYEASDLFPSEKDKTKYYEFYRR